MGVTQAPEYSDWLRIGGYVAAGLFVFAAPRNVLRARTLTIDATQQMVVDEQRSPLGRKQNK